MKKLATTGVAAHLIGGETVHHFFRMDIKGKSYAETGTIAYEMINATDIIVIDEFSMLDSPTFHSVNRILREMAIRKDNQFKPFAGKHVILMGDPAQLPAISGHIFNTELWKRFEIVMLRNVTRQDDKTFQDLLSKIRVGTVTSEIDATLKSRLIEARTLDDINIDDAAIICSTRKERDAWNKRYLETIDTEEFSFEAIDTNAVGHSISDSEKSKLKLYHRERWPDVLTIKVGACVLLLKNIDVECSWINGTHTRIRCRSIWSHQGCHYLSWQAFDT